MERKYVRELRWLPDLSERRTDKTFTSKVKREVLDVRVRSGEKVEEEVKVVGKFRRNIDHEW